VLWKSKNMPDEDLRAQPRGPSGVTDVVAKQIACGLDVINDGEQGRTTNHHVKDRLAGFDGPSAPHSQPASPIFPTIGAARLFASPFQARPACSGASGWKDFRRSRLTLPGQAAMTDARARISL